MLQQLVKHFQGIGDGQELRVGSTPRIRHRRHFRRHVLCNVLLCGVDFRIRPLRMPTCTVEETRGQAATLIWSED